MTIFYCTLPIPPSANCLFPTSRSGHRFPSKKYKAWRKEAEAWLEKAQMKAPLMLGRIRATYVFSFPDKRKRDVANFEKGPTDLLVALKVMDDDSQIDDLILHRGPLNKESPCVFICLEEID